MWRSSSFTVSPQITLQAAGDVASVSIVMLQSLIQTCIVRFFISLTGRKGAGPWRSFWALVSQGLFLMLITSFATVVCHAKLKSNLFRGVWIRAPQILVSIVWAKGLFSSVNLSNFTDRPESPLHIGWDHYETMAITIAFGHLLLY